MRIGELGTIDRKGDAPVLLVRDGLHAGNVITAEATERSLDDGPVRMALRGREYRLALLRNRAESMRGARLVFSSGKDRQVLYSLGPKWHANDPTWTLLWAGDLDGDGKLDLYVEVADDEDVSDRRLYLSSHAGKARLVRKAVRFYTTGC